MVHRFIALDGDLDSLVRPALVLPGAAVVPIELVLDAPAREAGRILSSGGRGVEVDAPGVGLLEHRRVVGVRREEHAGAGRELQGSGHEATRRQKFRAGGGWKPVGIHRADIDVEVVAIGVLGDDDQAGQHPAVRVGARVDSRVEELRMVVAAGGRAVITALQDVAHEDARCNLRLRRHRPEEHAAQRQQCDEQQRERRNAPRGGED